MKENSLLTKVLYKGERWIYENADEIIFTGGGLRDYISEHNWSKTIPNFKLHYINNGVDLTAFDNNKDCYQIKDSDIINKSVFKVIYAGSIRKVNNLGLLLDVAKKIKNKRVLFLIWGDGDEKDALMKRVYEEKIENIKFKGKVAKKYIPYITSCADLNIAHCNPSKLFRFGISFNKIFEYFAAGKPILCDFECRYNPVIMMNAGMEISNPTPEKVARTIDSISMMEKGIYEKYCYNARKAAKQYDFASLTKELCKVIEVAVVE